MKKSHWVFGFLAMGVCFFLAGLSFFGCISPSKRGEDRSKEIAEVTREIQAQREYEKFIRPLWAVKFITDAVADSFHLSFHTIGGRNFKSSVSEIEVLLDDQLDGTYVQVSSFKEERSYLSRTLEDYGYGVTLSVGTKENWEYWSTYLKKLKDLKRDTESPREVFPPDHMR